MRDSKWFKEGAAANVQCNTEGKLGAICPYAVKSAKWYLWNEGWTSVTLARDYPAPGVDSSKPVA